MSQTTPYRFTSGTALAARLREIAEQIDYVGDLAETALIVNFQVSGTSDAGPARRLAAIAELANALGGKVKDGEFDHEKGTCVRIAYCGNLFTNVYGVVPMGGTHVTERRAKLLAELAKLDTEAGILPTVQAVLTPDAPDLPTELVRPSQADGDLDYGPALRAAEIAEPDGTPTPELDRDVAEIFGEQATAVVSAEPVSNWRIVAICYALDRAGRDSDAEAAVASEIPEIVAFDRDKLMATLRDGQTLIWTFTVVGWTVGSR